MTAVQISDIQNNSSFSNLFMRVSKGEQLEISGEENESIIMISKKQFQEMQKTIHNERYLSKLDKGLEAIRKGETGVQKSIAELEAMAYE